MISEEKSWILLWLILNKNVTVRLHQIQSKIQNILGYHSDNKSTITMCVEKTLLLLLIQI
jgi:hypothetical protein